MAAEVDEARRRDVERSAELASEKERNAAHRMIHDSALQTLETLSRDTALSLDDVRALARAEAAALRHAITDGDDDPADLVVRLREVVDRFGRRGLKVELVTAELVDDPVPAVTSAFCNAVGEALTNVAKHAGVDRVVVRVANVSDGIRLTVRDHGKGYDTSAQAGAGGFGQRHWIRERMDEVGGRGEVWSQPGRGTRGGTVGTELIPIAVVEDHPLYRRGLTQTATQSDSLDLVAATSSLEELDPTDLKRAAVVILDLHLPGIEGADAVRFVRSAGPEVLVLSASDDPIEVIEAIGAGAAGYLTKSADTEEIILAIGIVSSGATYVSPVLAGHLLHQAQKKEPASPLELTPREREILELVAEGEHRRRHCCAALHQRSYGPLPLGPNPGEDGSATAHRS